MNRKVILKKYIPSKIISKEEFREIVLKFQKKVIPKDKIYSVETKLTYYGSKWLTFLPVKFWNNQYLNKALYILDCDERGVDNRIKFEKTPGTHGNIREMLQSGHSLLQLLLNGPKNNTLDRKSVV